MAKDTEEERLVVGTKEGMKERMKGGEETIMRIKGIGLSVSS